VSRDARFDGAPRVLRPNMPHSGLPRMQWRQDIDHGSPPNRGIKSPRSVP